MDSPHVCCFEELGYEKGLEKIIRRLRVPYSRIVRKIKYWSNLSYPSVEPNLHVLDWCHCSHEVDSKHGMLAHFFTSYWAGITWNSSLYPAGNKWFIHWTCLIARTGGMFPHSDRSPSSCSDVLLELFRRWSSCHWCHIGTLQPLVLLR